MIIIHENNFCSFSVCESVVSAAVNCDDIVLIAAAGKEKEDTNYNYTYLFKKNAS